MSKICSQDKCIKIARGTDHMCSACRKRLWRQKNPMMASYRDHITNSKKRGIPWNLSFEDFQEFCIRHEYMTKKGRTASCMTIDRIFVDIGYEKGNLQPLSNSANAAKRWIEYMELPEGKSGLRWRTMEATDYSDVPF